MRGDLALRPEVVLVQSAKQFFVSMSSMSRSSTIEAQRDPSPKARSLRRLRDIINAAFHVPDDLAERELKSAISKSSGDECAFLKTLLRNYTRVKANSGFAVIENLLQCWTFQEDAKDDIIQSRTFTVVPNSVVLNGLTRPS